MGVGIDLCEIPRMTPLLTNDKFIARILTEAEQEILRSFSSAKRQSEFLAGRFACKEAYAKANRTGLGKEVSFHDLEILRNEKNEPIFTKHPKVDYKVHVSISHTDDVATAIVILEKD